MSAKPDRKELRTFGISLGVVSLIWAAVMAWRGKAGAVPWLVGAAPVLFALAWLAPAALRPVHLVWMPVARGIARAMTWLMLTTVFYLVFTPYGVILRLLRKDALDRRIDRGRSSYWITRRDGPFDPSRLDRQY